MKKVLIYLTQLIFVECIKLKYSKNKRVRIFDIDNTLANTYQTIDENGNIPFSQLSVFPKVLKMVKNDCRDSNMIVLFFTVRPVKFWVITYRWLIKQGINVSLFQLYLCQFPMQKVEMIKMLKKKWPEIMLIDDMSYNHEKGEVKFYYSVINTIRTMGLDYIGYTELKKLQ